MKNEKHEIIIGDTKFKVDLQKIAENEYRSNFYNRIITSDNGFYYENVHLSTLSKADLKNLVQFFNSFIEDKTILFDENLVGKKIVSKLNPKKESHEVVNFFVYNNVKCITIAMFQVEEGTPNERTMFGIISENEFYQDFEVIN